MRTLWYQNKMFYSNFLFAAFERCLFKLFSERSVLEFERHLMLLTANLLEID